MLFRSGSTTARKDAKFLGTGQSEYESLMDTITTPHEAVTLDDLAFHPKVREELQAELKKHTEALEIAPLESIQKLQGRVAILRWVLDKMSDEIIQRERDSAKMIERSDARSHSAEVKYR